jgi:enoyl-CoA hydratase
MIATSADFEIEPLVDGCVFRLTRPAKLNAITKPVLLGLQAVLDQLEPGSARSSTESDVAPSARSPKILLITGSGSKAFCAGTDLAETSASSPSERQAKTALARDILVRLSRSKVLSVAAINGLAFGGGLELAMACTFRVAEPHATFSLPEIKLGLLPAYGGTQFLPPLVGRARAAEIMLTGQVLNASYAHGIGLINRLCEPGRSLDEARRLAQDITRHSALAIDAIWRCLEASRSTVSDAGLAVEDREVRRVFGSAEAKEGIAAFLEKREARFNRP